MTCHTPGQTVGPFFGFALPTADGEHLVPPTHPDAVRLRGTVYDGAGDPVPDALLEIWQADADGRVPQAEGSLHRDGWTFTGFGRAATDGGGRYASRRSSRSRARHPYIAMTVFARGLLDRLFTRVLPARSTSASRPTRCLLRCPPSGAGRWSHAEEDGRGSSSTSSSRVEEAGDGVPRLRGSLMTDLFWPGDERARAELRAERPCSSPWSRSRSRGSRLLGGAGIAPGDPVRRAGPRGPRRSTTPRPRRPATIPLVEQMRRSSSRELVARRRRPSPWLHRGLTSQDVLDTALVLLARAHRPGPARRPGPTGGRSIALVGGTATTSMAGRTLTQHAVPITFGLKAAQWLAGVLDARDDVRALRFPVQVGGAAGTLAAVAEIAGDPDAASSSSPTWPGASSSTTASPGTPTAPRSRGTPTRWSAPPTPWGTWPTTSCCSSRAEIAELHEPGRHGRGGSSTMPHKQNPVLSVLIRRAALAAPGLAAQLHLAAASMVDERADGALAPRVVRAGRPCPGAPWSPPPRRPSSSKDCAWTPGGWRPTSSSTPSPPRRARQPGTWSRRRHDPTRPRRLPRRHAARSSTRSSTARQEDMTPALTLVRLTGPPTGPSCPCWCSARRWAPRPRRSGARCAQSGLTDALRRRRVGPARATATTTRVADESFTVAELARGVLQVLDDVQEHRGELGGAFYYAGDSVGGAVGLQLLLDHPGPGDCGRHPVLRRQDRRRLELGRTDRAGRAVGHRRPGRRLHAERWFAPGFLDRSPDTAIGAPASASRRRRPRLHRRVRGAGSLRRARPARTRSPRRCSPSPARTMPSPPSRGCASIADGVKDGRLVVLDDVAHLAPAEAPTEVARAAAGALPRASGP